MAEDKIQVKTSDGQTLEVEADVAKQWAPIKNMYEAFGSLDTKNKPIELENVDTETLNKVYQKSFLNNKYFY
jgi:hypothetical protein